MAGHLDVRDMAGGDALLKDLGQPCGPTVVFHPMYPEPGDPQLEVVDMRMDAFSRGGMSRPMLLMRLSDGTVLGYRTLAPLEEAQPGFGEGCVDRTGARVRFVRMDIGWPLVGIGAPESQRPAGVAGPPWGGMTRLDGIRKDLPSLTQFHNLNCPHGFLYVAGNASLNFCQLPTRTSFTSVWPMRRIPTKCTLHALAYQAETASYMTLASAPQPARKRRVEEGDQHASMASIAAASAAATSGDREEAHELRLVSPGSWGIEWRQPLEPGEVALCVRPVVLRVGGLASGASRPFVAVGTAFAGGEDVPTRGRVLLLEMQHTSTPEEVQQWSGQLLYSHEFKGQTRGPVTAIVGMEGYLLLAIGTKLMLYIWNGKTLEGCAFFDVPLYVTSMCSVKNFVLLGDVYKSIIFLQFKEDKDALAGKHLQQVAKDFGQMAVMATEFLIESATLSLLVSDHAGNLHIFAVESYGNPWGSQNLVERAAFQLGSKVSKFIRRRPAPLGEKKGPKGRNECALFGTFGGALGCVSPLEETAFRRLQVLQEKLARALVHTAGLNPLTFRRQRQLPNEPPRQPAPSYMLDADLLWRYINDLEIPMQYKIARMAGTSRDQIMLNLRELAVILSPSSMVVQGEQ
ncbi:hypothetical protein CYMTET_24739 [Cymbomonas tetramitiformis]|uniref:RSE1/DDB1/CPSF1 C-terminal domain-containing protein n=1 Tax=Cymbomonas tetramitiformis TaxID=36881 RepID=A0AAE0FVF3_9CHLO|nr:hypothetical protein CYMTET_24739 [Cymbomonas tetramitiformis]